MSRIGSVGQAEARDGYILRYRVWGRDSSRGTIVLLSGVMSHSAWFGELAQKLSLKYKVIGADRRGAGINRVDRGDAPSGETLIDDLSTIIRAEHGQGAPLYLVGWCWGAVLAVHGALVFGERVERVILLAPGIFPSRAIVDTARYQQKDALRCAGDGRATLETPIREEMFTTGRHLQNFILKDDARLTRITPRYYWIMVKLQAAAVKRLGKLTQPLLIVFASKDVVVDNEKTRRRFEQSGVVASFVECDSHHGIQFECPNELHQHIDRWLEGDPLPHDCGRG